MNTGRSISSFEDDGRPSLSQQCERCYEIFTQQNASEGRLCYLPDVYKRRGDNRHKACFGYFYLHHRDNDNQVNRANMPSFKFSIQLTTNPFHCSHQNKLQQFRHVILPKELAKTLPKTRLLSENEWRSIGVQQSRGWQHYAIHRPEPHILLFRRPLGTDPQTGAIDQELKRLALEEYKGQFGLRGH